MYKEMLMQQGWECPKCGRVYSPSTSMCKYCGNKEYITTAGNYLEMRDFTEEELKEYRKVLDNCYKPTGINLFDLDNICPCAGCEKISIDCLNDSCKKFTDWVKKNANK
jgi:hypothetical protein